MGVVLPLLAWYFLYSSGITSVCAVFMSVGVVLPLCALFITSEGVFYRCGRGVTFVRVDVTS